MNKADYKANGGFLQETPVERNGKILAALPTRDAVIVILSLLAMAKQEGKKISALTDTLPRVESLNQGCMEIIGNWRGFVIT